MFLENIKTSFFVFFEFEKMNHSEIDDSLQINHAIPPLYFYGV